ncbi:ACP S-malonyltransferase [Conexibacter stalactiti]|uniref:Malonyl CoA-acyl carrier protein transacylase n=1 Tax=Conexibacter stalactiti TaxID=1940611 RepID=A0ABU4HTA9_9ACTN|nr:ACP S-malonyltransferase [Conexibacter stalactiti]MDW5596531.1 ACP S-malonyltransferase [Conexibacter stalactiti]MEC5037173.1 ACP S-malonyltransferase [Conexibacter stalactiti]
MKTAVLFPGQGSQTPDMRDQVAARRPDLIELALDVVGDDPFARVDDGTRFAQPAIYCASVVAWERLAESGLQAEVVAGHSLGELAALVAAGVLSAEDGLRVVATRGRLMQESGERAGDGSMLALLGTGAAERASQVAEPHGLTVANDNAPNQVVLSGSRGAFSAATVTAKGLGLRAVPLPVTGAFHSPFMAEAVPEFAAALAAVEFSAPSIEVVSSITTAPFDDVAARLADALTQPVRWRETLLTLHAGGATRFVETGPGKVLTGLVRRTVSDVEAVTAEQLEAASA